MDTDVNEKMVIQYDPGAWEALPLSAKEEYLYHHEWYAYRRNIATWTLELAPTSILDVGCGPGHLLKYLRSLKYMGSYLGIDLTPTFINFAKKHHEEKNFELGDVRDLRNYKSGFDLVICSHVLDHMLEIARPCYELFHTARKFLILSVLGSTGEPSIMVDHTLFNRTFTLQQIMLLAPAHFHLRAFKKFSPEWDKSGRDLIFQFLFENLAI